MCSSLPSIPSTNLDSPTGSTTHWPCLVLGLYEAKFVLKQVHTIGSSKLPQKKPRTKIRKGQSPLVELRPTVFNSSPGGSRRISQFRPLIKRMMYVYCWKVGGMQVSIFQKVNELVLTTTNLTCLGYYLFTSSLAAWEWHGIRHGAQSWVKQDLHQPGACVLVGVGDVPGTLCFQW